MTWLRSTEVAIILIVELCTSYLNEWGFTTTASSATLAVIQEAFLVHSMPTHVDFGIIR